MTLKNLTIISSIALGLIAVPAADAQRGEGRSARTSAMRTQSPPVSAGPRTQSTARGEITRAESHRWRHRGDGHRHWGNHNHWRHRHYYPRYYGGFGYPYGFGRYPYGFGYGYGYPYFGASAALYYNGYHPHRYQATHQVRGVSVAAEVQQALARAGYYRGAIDGVVGNGTRNAIRAYERANGLRVDGQIDQELLRSMRLG